MASLTVKMPNVEHVLSKLRPELYQPALRALLTDAALLGEREARANAPKDTSALARSITHQVMATSARVYSPLGYALAMEEGRRPGAPMPPPQALVGWMRRHGLGNIPPFVIARAIGRRGIKGRFFLRRAMQTVEQAAPRLAMAAADRISKEWGS